MSDGYSQAPGEITNTNAAIQEAITEFVAQQNVGGAAGEGVGVGVQQQHVGEHVPALHVAQSGNTSTRWGSFLVSWFRSHAPPA